MIFNISRDHVFIREREHFLEIFKIQVDDIISRRGSYVLMGSYVLIRLPSWYLYTGFLYWNSISQIMEKMSFEDLKCCFNLMTVQFHAYFI